MPNLNGNLKHAFTIQIKLKTLYEEHDHDIEKLMEKKKRNKSNLPFAIEKK